MKVGKRGPEEQHHFTPIEQSRYQVMPKWSIAKRCGVIALSILLTAGAASGISLALAASLAVILGTTIGSSALIGAITTWWVNRKVIRLVPEPGALHTRIDERTAQVLQPERKQSVPLMKEVKLETIKQKEDLDKNAPPAKAEIVSEKMIEVPLKEDVKAEEEARKQKEEADKNAQPAKAEKVSEENVVAIAKKESDEKERASIVPQEASSKITPAVSKQSFPVSHSLAAQFLGGAFISGAYLEGEKLEGGDVGEVYAFIHRVLEEEISARRAQQSEEVVKKLEFLQQAVAQFVKFLQEAPKSPASFVKWMQDKVHTIPVGSSLFFPGGWHPGPSSTPGHAMLYELYRQPNGKLTMRVYNSGAGIENHPGLFLNRQKYMPCIEQGDLNEENLQTPEVWHTYYRLQFQAPTERPYRVENIYDNFLSSIHPRFVVDAKKRAYEHALKEDEVISPQIVGTCTADSFFAFAWTYIGDKKLYKNIKNAMEFRIFDYYYQSLEVASLFNSAEPKLSAETLNKRLGILRYFKLSVQKLALSVEKAARHHWISGADKLHDTMKKALDRVRVATTTYEQRLKAIASAAPFTVPDTSTLDFRPIPAGSSSKEKKIHSKGLMKEAGIVTWPTKTDELIPQMKKWVADSSNSEAFNSLLSEVLRTMPSVASPYWDQLPATSYDQVCTEINHITESWITSQVDLSDGDIPRIDMIIHIQKTLAVVQKLISRLPEKSDPDGIRHCRINVTQLPHDAKTFAAQTAFFPVTDPHLDRELSETLHYFRSIRPSDARVKQKAFDGMFRAAQPETNVIEEISKNFGQEMHEAQQFEKEAGYHEQLFIYNYLKRNKDVEQKIREKIWRQSGYVVDGRSIWSKAEDIDKRVVMAEALTDLYGHYLPPGFIALRKQAHLVMHVLRERLTKDANWMLLFNFDFFSDYLMQHREGKADAPIKVTQRFPYTVNQNAFPRVGSFIESQYDDQTGISPQSEILQKFKAEGEKIATQNQIMLLQRPRDYSEKLSSETYHALLLLGCPEDKSHQIVKTVAYFANNYTKLSNPVYQAFFVNLVFERGLLREQLQAHPNFVLTLLSFVKKGFQGARETNDVSSAIFFLRISSYFKAFCRDMQKELAVGDDVLDQFPYPTPDLVEGWIKLQSLTDVQRSLIIREELAACFRIGNLTRNNCAALLRHAIRLRDNPIPSKYRSAYAPEIDRAVNELCRKIAHFLQEQQTKDQIAILNEAVGAPASTGWDAKDYPIVRSSDGHYGIDLVYADRYIQGLRKGALPRALLSARIFFSIFCNKAVHEITSSEKEASWKDERGNYYRANQTDKTNWNIQRKVTVDGRDVWGDVFIETLPFNDRIHTNSITTSCWFVYTPPPKETILFFNKKSGDLQYQYEYRTKLLTCVIPGDVREGLALLNTQQKEARDQRGLEYPIRFFTRVDELAQFWKDSVNNRIEIVELPTYRLFFKVEHPSGRIVPIPPQDGFYVSPEQNLAKLRGIPGYIVLQDTNGRKRVILPRHFYLDRFDFAKEQIRDLAITRMRGMGTHYVYQVDSKGHLHSTELTARIYLAYIYLMQRDYKGAKDILEKRVHKPFAYTFEEGGLLSYIGIEEISNDKDPRASALRLLAISHLMENKSYYGLAEKQKDDLNWSFVKDRDIQTDLKNYLNQLSQVGPFALSRDQEIRLLSLESNVLDLVCRRRFKHLLSMDTPGTASQKTLVEKQLITDFVYNFISTISPSQNLEINMKILDEFDQLLRPTVEDLCKAFCTFYHIARQDPPNEEQLRRLKARLHLIERGDQDRFQQDYVTILFNVIQHRQHFIPAQELVDLLNVTGQFSPENLKATQALYNSKEKAKVFPNLNVIFEEHRDKSAQIGRSSQEELRQWIRNGALQGLGISQRFIPKEHEELFTLPVAPLAGAPKEVLSFQAVRRHAPVTPMASMCSAEQLYKGQTPIPRKDADDRALTASKIQLEEAEKKRKAFEQEVVAKGAGAKDATELSAAASKEFALVQEIQLQEEEKLIAQLSSDAMPAFFAKDTATVNRQAASLKQIGGELVGKLQAANKNVESQVEQSAIQRLIKDIEEYAQQRPAEQVVFNRSRLDDLKKMQHCWKGMREEQTHRLKRKLLRLANRLPVSPAERQSRQLELTGGRRLRITMNDLERLYVRGNAAEYMRLNPTLTADDVQQLYEGTEDFLCLDIHRQQINQLQKAIEGLEALSTLRDDHPRVRDQMQQIHALLTVRRNFNRKEHAEYYPALLVFEHRAELTLRPEQVSHITQLLRRDIEFARQIVMGGGKSDILLALLALLMADGQSLSTVVVLEEQLNQVAANMQTRSGEIFDQLAQRVDWRASPLHILERLKQIRDNRQFLLVSDQEMREFALRAFQNRYQYASSGADRDYEEAFREIKKLLGTQARAIIDEVDAICYCRQERHTALTQGTPVSPAFVETSEILYNLLLTNPDITRRLSFEFAPGPGPAFTPQHYASVKPILIEGALKKLQEEQKPLASLNKSQIERITHYLSTEEGSRIVAALPADLTPQQVELIRFLRSEIQQFLPVTLNRRLGENYGSFPPVNNRPQGLAGPYAGSRPNIGSQFGHTTEQMNYTRQTFAKEGLSAELLKLELDRIKEAVGKEWNVAHVQSPMDTESYQEYLTICGADVAKEFPLYELNDEKIAEIARRISQDQTKLQAFVGRYVLRDGVKEYPLRVTINAMQVIDQFGQVQGVSGTLESSNTFHQRFTSVHQQGISASILCAFAQHSLDDVAVVNERNPVTELERLLSSKQASEYKALIDEGGLFRDVSSAALATLLLNTRLDLDAVVFTEGNRQYIRQRRDQAAPEIYHSKQDVDPTRCFTIQNPWNCMANIILAMRAELDAVVYFDGDTPMILRRGQVPQQFTRQNDIDPNKRFTLYDQRHCRGTHVDQDPYARAWMTFNRLTTLSRAEQAAYRMRRITTSQRISCLIPQDLDSILKARQEGRYNVLDLMLYTARVQAHQQADDGRMSTHQKIHNIFFREIDRWLDSLHIDTLRNPAFKALNELLINVVTEKPPETAAKKEDADKVLVEYRDSLLRKLNAWDGKLLYPANFSQVYETIQKETDAIIKEALAKRHVDAKLMDYGTAQDKKDIAVAVQMQVKVQAESKAKVAIEQKAEVEQEQKEEVEQERLYSTMGKECKALGAIPWLPMNQMFTEQFYKVPAGDSPKEVHASYYIDRAQQQKLNAWMPIEQAFRLSDASTEDIVKGIFEGIVPSLGALYTASNLGPLTYFQKPFGACLIVQDTNSPNNIELRPLDGAAAEAIKKQLLEDRQNRLPGMRQKRVFLYYPDIGIYQQGAMSKDDVEARDALLRTPRFQLLIVKYQFLRGQSAGYTKEQMAILETWIKSHPNPAQLQAFFLNKLARTAHLKRAFGFSPLARIFKEASASRSDYRSKYSAS